MPRCLLTETRARTHRWLDDREAWLWIGLTTTGFVTWRAPSLALDPTGYADVPAAVVARLRSLCLGLPESVEKQAWAGTQWRIRDRMYAHVLTVDFVDGPVTVMTFRSSGPELDALRGAGHPFFRPAGEPASWAWCSTPM